MKLTFYSTNKNEVILGLLMVHPILQYLANAVTDIKVNGSSGEKGLELYMIELSGGYLTFDLSCYLKDYVKGYWGSYDLFNNIVTILNYGNFKIIKYLQTYFFHTHGTRSTNLGHKFTCLKNLSNISHWNFSTSSQLKKLL
ncbi:hypothetical protein RhiirA5_420813 [Rhizophagus irregularis]|uniref:Uncharacterized protein n=1 Tax=Rhizophagus irregularis TaxID=588596 RepID=A0A2N0QP14_9GLOM|nr:hypothetical protein RhiirA5_420813 [Rhizophagus irregularis]PKC52798.1 hypothetical protein RhiirA1_480655 [Rhizophagus irregularis]